MSPDGVIGWDLGGAHLKAAWVDGAGRLRRVLQRPCRLWQGWAELDTALREAAEALPLARTAHAVTMTGELVDLFASRAEGVERLAQVAEGLPGFGARLYAGRAGFLEPAACRAHAREVASANWWATTQVVARRLPEGLAVDVGSTTSDVVAFAGTGVAARGYTDCERLATGELVYMGVVRTPLAAFADRAPLDGRWVALMAEPFATAADVYRLTGELPSDADQMETADGRGREPRDSARRVARMLGCDVDDASPETWRLVAGFFAERQRQRLQAACTLGLSRRQLSARAPLVGAGVGRFLVRVLAQRLERPYYDFSELIGAEPAAADCAPAVSIALLAREEAVGA